MCYFFNFDKHYELVYRQKATVPFSAGDILALSFRNKGSNYFFEGICIAVRKKKLMHPESTLILRNILGAVGIEVSFSYFCNRVFILRLNSFKRKKISYARVKLYYIRHKLGQASRVV